MCAKTRDREASSKAILDSAEEWFLRVGVEAASISGIAKQAGVTKGLIFYHFESKERLAEAVKTRLNARSALGLQERLVEFGTGPEVLFQAFQLYFQFHLDNAAATRMMSWDYLEATPPHPAMVELRAAVVGRLREAQEAGQIRADVDPEAVVIAGFSMIEHWFEIQDSLKVSAAPTAVDSETYLQTTLSLIRQGLLPLDQR